MNLMKRSEGKNTSAIKNITIVFNKEVRDNLRDRRSMVSTLISPLIGPAILVVMIMVLGKTMINESREATFDLPVVGAQYAPSLVQFLEQNGAVIKPAPEDPKDEVRNGNLNVVLIIPEDYAINFNTGQPAAVQLVVDSSRQSATVDIERVHNLLAAYKSQIGNLRLLARGISPVITNAVDVERVDVATPQSQVMIFLNMMPYFIVLTVFVGGMYVIIDTTAGERERGSLEPLLINPVQRKEFVLGKLCASLPFAAFAVFITLLAFVLAFNLVPLEEYLGFQMTIDPLPLVGIFLVSLPMIVLASAIQMIVATFTRSFKEAQTYVAFLPLIPALPGVLLAFLPVKPSMWNMLIPTFGQQLIINQIMRGEPLNILYVVVSILATLILAAALIFVAVRLYERERILFGTR
jgi:sodium transport system permease protein